MTRRHFEALSKALKQAKPSEQDVLMQSGEYNQWKRDVEAVSDACIEANDRFDYQRFKAACGCQ